MKESIILFTLFSYAASATISAEQLTKMNITVAFVDKFLTALEPFKEYFPSYISEAVEGLTTAQKEAIVDFTNAYHADAFTPTPHTYDAFMDIVKTNYSVLFDVINSTHTLLEEDIDKLGTEAKAFAQKWEAQAYVDADPDRVTWACNILNNAHEMIKEAVMDDSAEEAQIDEVFPGTVEFYNSKYFQAYVIALRTMPSSYDCVKDRQQIVNQLLLLDKGGLLQSAVATSSS